MAQSGQRYKSKCIYMIYFVIDINMLWKSLFRRTFWSYNDNRGPRKRKRDAEDEPVDNVWKARFKTQVNWSNGNYRLQKFQIPNSKAASVCGNLVFYVEGRFLKAYDLDSGLIKAKYELPQENNKPCISAFPYQKCSQLVCLGFDNSMVLLLTCNSTFEQLISHRIDETVISFAYAQGVLAIHSNTSIQVYRVDQKLELFHRISSNTNASPNVSVSPSCFGRDHVCIALTFYQPLISKETIVCIQELHFNTAKKSLYTSRLARARCSAAIYSTTAVIAYRIPHLILGTTSNLLAYFRVHSNRQRLSIEQGQTLWGHCNAVTHVDLLAGGNVAVSVSRNGQEINRWDLHARPQKLLTTVPTKFELQDYNQLVSSMSSSDRRVCLLKDCLQSLVVYDFA